MKNRKARTKNNRLSKFSIKLETECNIRLWCSRLATIMGVGGVVSLLFGQSFTHGFTLCACAIVLMSMALGYRQIELVFKTLRMRMRR
jgi:Mn2+/Fe2+ NRAMP family transporter